MNILGLTMLMSTTALRVLVKDKEAKQKPDLLKTNTSKQATSVAVSSWPLELQKLKNLNNGIALAKPANKTKRLAVLISGVQDRIILESKIKNVFSQASMAGYDVDVYMSLVKSSAHPKENYSPQRNTIASVQMHEESTIKTAFKGHANLAWYDLLDHQENFTVPDKHPKRLTQYFGMPWGRNILRKYESWEGLYNKTMQSDKKYDFYLVTRDDDEWLGPINMAKFESFDYPGNMLWTKACKEWEGINDKTLVLGAHSAGKILGQIWTHFFDPEPTLVTSNAEKFLKEFAHLKDVHHWGVGFEYLPTADSVYVQDQNGHPKLCQKAMYLCEQANALVTNHKITKPDTCAGQGYDWPAF